MIYLIGGPPRCGKTTLARRLAATVSSPWIQTDYLEAAISRYRPADADNDVDLRQDHETKAPTPACYDALYARYSAAECVASDRARAQRTWPGVQAIIETALSDDDDLIIEGFHIDPVLIGQHATVASAGGGTAVRGMFLVREDFTETLASIKRSSRTNDWLHRGIQQDVTFERVAHMIILYSASIRADAAQNHFAVISVDGDFDRQLEQAIDVLVT